MSNLLSRASRLTLIEKTNLDSAVELAKVYQSPDSTREEKLTVLLALLPYQYPKMKQIELNDVTVRRRPEEIERDITALVDRLARSAQLELAPPRQRDLIGSDQ